MFLMHRVELKDSTLVGALVLLKKVRFLMHRVELKVIWACEHLFGGQVPNAPCGVESHGCEIDVVFDAEFLMHRVELKEIL